MGERITNMQQFRDRRQVASKVALCTFRDALSTPCNKHTLRESSVWVSDPHKGELCLPLREFVNKIAQFTIFKSLVSSYIPHCLVHD
jgi:hypothetical protein